MKGKDTRGYPYRGYPPTTRPGHNAGNSVSWVVRAAGLVPTRSKGAALYEQFHSWPNELTEILEKFDQSQSLNTEGGRDLHLAFDYYCCYMSVCLSFI